jgi:hypothetical protein
MICETLCKDYLRVTRTIEGGECKEKFPENKQYAIF